MLIKITLVAIVICIALLIISRMYFRTLSTSGKLRLAAGINYRKGEKQTGETDYAQIRDSSRESNADDSSGFDEDQRR